MSRGLGPRVVPRAATKAGTDPIGVEEEIDQLDVIGLDAQTVEADQAAVILEHEDRRPNDVVRRGKALGAQRLDGGGVVDVMTLVAHAGDDHRAQPLGLGRVGAPEAGLE